MDWKNTILVAAVIIGLSNIYVEKTAATNVKTPTITTTSSSDPNAKPTFGETTGAPKN